MGPLPKIYECLAGDELRPAMNYALLKKDEIAASDAHILIVHASSELFDAEFLESLPDEGVLLGKEVLQDLAKSDIFKVEYIPDHDLLKIIHMPNRGAAHNRYYEVKLESKTGWKYPNYKAIFPGKDQKVEKISTIGVNPILLAKLSKAMGNNDGISMEFYGEGRFIICRPKGGDYSFCKGIIMPTLAT